MSARVGADAVDRVGDVAQREVPLLRIGVADREDRLLPGRGGKGCGEAARAAPLSGRAGHQRGGEEAGKAVGRRHGNSCFGMGGYTLSLMKQQGFAACPPNFAVPSLISERAHPCESRGRKATDPPGKAGGQRGCQQERRTTPARWEACNRRSTDGQPVERPRTAPVARLGERVMAALHDWIGPIAPDERSARLRLGVRRCAPFGVIR